MSDFSRQNNQTHTTSVDFVDCENCFCNELCKITSGSIIRNNYEYLTCDKKECDYLGVRCTSCRNLCNIIISRDTSTCRLFWGCQRSNNNNCQFFKRDFLVSLTNHVPNCENILSINANVLCKYVSKYVDKLQFTNILKRFFEAGKLNNASLDEIKKYFSDDRAIIDFIENEFVVIDPTTPNRNNILPIRNLDSPTPNRHNMLPIRNLDSPTRYTELDEDIDIKKLEEKFNKQFEIMQEKHDFLEKKFDDNLVKINTDISGLNNKMEENLVTIKSDIVGLNNKMDKIEGNFSTLFRSLKLNSEEITELSDNNTSRDNNFNIINNNFKELSKSMNENFKNVISILKKRKRHDETDDETIGGANSDDSNIKVAVVKGGSKSRGRGRGGRGRGGGTRVRRSSRVSSKKR
jgi:hypothetical protein